MRPVVTAAGLIEQLFAQFMFSVLGYLLTPVLTNTALSRLASTLQTAAPGVFWLLSASIFDDHFRVRPCRW
ncbi:MAG: hypothetical protein RIC38_16290 [Chromatocurvus sp.]